jgi:acetyl/propionyl-CoA carboxylase alpha subunit
VFNPPGGTGVRVDTAAYAEGVIPPYYDSLIAKLIARGRDRDEAISRMSRRWKCSSSKGFYDIPLHRRIMRDPDFRAGNFDTKFMERFLAKNGKVSPSFTDTRSTGSFEHQKSAVLSVLSANCKCQMPQALRHRRCLCFAMPLRTTASNC